MASIRIRPAVEADAHPIARVHDAALDAINDFYAAFFVSPPRDILALATEAALRKPGTSFLVAEDEGSGSVVGFIRYEMHEPISTSAPAPVASDNPAPAFWKIKPHMEGLWTKVNAREDEMDAMYETTVGGKRHAHVRHIMVSPTHQRKGIGGRLLREILDMADRKDMPTYICASAESKDLYAKLGFEFLGSWTIDNGALAEEAEALGREMGIKDNEGLAERFRGVKEVEPAMVRWPPHQ